MKINKFLVAVLAAGAIFASCSKESSDNGNGNGEKANIVVSLANTRATGDIVSGGANSDNAVVNYMAFVYKASGVLEAYKASSSAADMTITNATTAATEVYVVANAPAALFSSVTSVGTSTKDDLAAIVGDLANGLVSTQTPGNIWASGSNTITFAPNSSNQFEATVAVQLTFVPARINLQSIDLTSVTGSTAYTIDNVFVLNAGGSSKFFGTSLIPATPSYYAGVDMTNFANKPAAYSVKSFLLDAYAAGQKYYYYVFENDDATTPVILALETTIGGNKRYFSLHFAPYDQAGEYVKRGQSYNVTMKLNINTDTDPGTVDPTIPSLPSELIVQVTPATWNPVPIIKTFN